MKYLWLFICSICFLTSCIKRDKYHIIQLNDSVIVSPDKVTCDIVMSPPLQIKVWDNNALFFHPGMHKSILLYNLKSSKEILWGNVGNGPDEFFSPSCIYENKSNSIIELFDMNLRKIVKYKVSINEQSIDMLGMDYKAVQTDSISLLGMHKMDNGWYVGFSGLGSNKMFCLIDENELKIIKHFGDGPIKGMYSQNFLQLYGWFASYGDKLFFASQPTGYLCCYDIDNKGNVVKKWEHQLTEPHFNEVSNKWEKNNKRGTYDIQANKDYVFLAFSGYNYEEGGELPQDILVFSHSGDFVKRIQLEGCMIGKFSVEGDYIYGIGDGCLTLFNWKNLILE